MIMLEQYDYLIQVIIRYLGDESTDEDKIFLQNWLKSNPDHQVWFNRFVIKENVKAELHEIYKIDVEGPLKKTHRLINEDWFITWGKRAAIAAAVIGIIWLVVQDKKSRSSQSENNVALHVKDSTSPRNDVVPGSDKAILTLENGFEINLDRQHNGLLSNHEGVNVVNEDSIVKYIKDSTGKSANPGYNTIKTPRGGQYQLLLSDGSKAWLNAASSIRYPLVFTDNERRVEITGEVYFEVAASKKRPFIVSVNDLEIEAWGTQFNVNAYHPQRRIRTTLVEGKLHLPSGDSNVVLSSGQAAEFTSDSKIIIEMKPNIKDAIAWKNGYFAFKDVVTMMQQLERWYDIKVKYLDTPKISFTWSIPRNTDFDSVVNNLQKSIRIYRQDRVLIVSKR